MKKKLQSRKFWVAAAVIVAGVLMMFGYSETSAETIAGSIVTIGGALGYLFAEAKADAAHADKNTYNADTATVEKVIEAMNNMSNGLKSGGDE